VSGIELLSVIRATETLANTPVIVLTADLFAVESVEELADHVIVKSYGVSRLRELVTQLASANTSSIGSAQAT
jgi:DNA-binding response OmpR family regulator